MAIFTYKPNEPLPPGIWDDYVVTGTTTYGYGLANAGLGQNKPPKNHPKHPSIVPANALYEPVGSSVTVSPYGEGEDIDWLVWFESKNDEVQFIFDLAAAGFKPEGSQNYDPDLFVSYKKGTENFILTYKAEFFDAFIKARNLCQFLNLKNKEDRIAVHQAIIKGEFPSYDPTPFASCGYGINDGEPVW